MKNSIFHPIFLSLFFILSVFTPTKHTLIENCVKNLGSIWYTYSNTCFQFLNNITHFFTLFHPHVFLLIFSNTCFQFLSAYTKHPLDHGFQNWTRPGGQTVKIGNRDENRFFKPKEPDFLLILWIVKSGVGPQEPVRTVRSNPLANLKKKKKKKLNTILFYLIKLSIPYKE